MYLKFAWYLNLKHVLNVKGMTLLTFLKKLLIDKPSRKY